MKFKQRLIIFFSCLIIFPLLVSIILSVTLLKQSLKHELDQRLRDSVLGIREHFEEIKKVMRSKLQVIVLDREMWEYRNKRNRALLLEKLVKLIDLGEFNILEVGDTAGKVIARGHNPDVWGETKLHYSIIANALAGQTTVDFEYGRSGLAIRAVRPILSGRDIIGTLMAGYSIDIRMAQREKMLTGLETGFYLDQGDHHSTFAPSFSIEPALFKKIKANQHNTQTITTISVDEQPYRVALMGLHRSDGSFLGIILTGKAMGEAYSFYYHVLRILLFNVLTGLILAIIIVVALSTGFSRPIEQLKKKMTLLGQGMFETRISVDRRDEFGDLERDFNKMAIHLENLTFKLQQAQSELVRKEKLALAGSLLAEIAHEIRNPLNSLAANIELLKKDLATGDRKKGEGRIGIAKNEIRKLDEKLSGFLRAVAPISATPRQADILKSLDRTLDFTEREREERGICLDQEHQEDRLVVAHDTELFYRVFLNVLKNAYESMPEGGSLSIKTRILPGEVEIVFRDTGCGMNPKEQKRIFEPYFTTKDSGTGIGLSYVVKVMEAHHGAVRVESWPRRGTEITLCLPVPESPGEDTNGEN